MANAGDTIVDFLSGKRITLLKTTGETGGGLLRFECLLPPGFAIPEHVHVGQGERHGIFSGTLRGRVDGQERPYVEGERVVAPADVPRAWRNPSDDEDLLIVSEPGPALRFEPFIEAAFAPAADFETHETAVPRSPLRVSMLLDESGDDFYPTGIPAPAWKAALALNAALSRGGEALGYYGSPGPEAAGDRRPGARGARAGFLATVALAGLAPALRWGVGGGRGFRR